MIQEPSQHVVEIILPNIPGYEHVAMAAAAAFAVCHVFPPERIEDLKTIVAEAVTNAIRHGNDGRPDAKVVVRMERIEGALEIRVADEGSGFRKPLDPDAEPEISDADPPGGFGLFLIHKLADRMDFENLAGGGHVVVMRLNLASAGSPLQNDDRRIGQDETPQ